MHLTLKPILLQTVLANYIYTYTYIQPQKKMKQKIHAQHNVTNKQKYMGRKQIRRHKINQLAHLFSYPTTSPIKTPWPIRLLITTAYTRTHEHRIKYRAY